MMIHKVKTLLLFPFLLAACDSGMQVSESELRALQSTGLSTQFHVYDHVGDVDSSTDAIPASQPFHVNSISEAIEVPIRDCTAEGLYEMERQMALNEAAADPSGQTVPVKFAYSFGTKHDALAKWANKRAVLSSENQGVSYIPVGGKLSSTYNGKHAYYEVDNTNVARQYVTGEKCFFSTIHVDPEKFHVSKHKYDFIKVSQEDLDKSPHLFSNPSKSNLSSLTHMIHYMYYGFCAPGRCAKGHAFAGEYASRLFQEVPSLDKDEPQIIKLYMADLRSGQIKHDIVKVRENTKRGQEIDSSISNILNVCEVQRNFYDVTKNLSLPAEVSDYEFDAINGAVQLVENILSQDVEGTVLSTQYTPIVIDLNGDGIKTSSVRWGTFFNMAGLANLEGVGQSHRTAWLGGDYVDYNPILEDGRVNMDVRLQARDGFLVIPNEQGQVTSSNQMFGDHTIVGGKTYDNGFKALQAYAGKNCASDKVQDLYVGPWDEDIYYDKLKIWVDENRNGLSEENEIKGLKDHRILAINACYIVDSREQDAFGNGTKLRSAVLMAGPYDYLLDNPTEIAHHLKYGQGLDGEKSYFNLAIDIIFKVNEDNRCPGGLLTVNDYPSRLPADNNDDEVGIGSDTPPAPLPPAPPIEPGTTANADPDPVTDLPDNF